MGELLNSSENEYLELVESTYNSLLEAAVEIDGVPFESDQPFTWKNNGPSDQPESTELYVKYPGNKKLIIKRSHSKEQAANPWSLLYVDGELEDPDVSQTAIIPKDEHQKMVKSCKKDGEWDEPAATTEYAEILETIQTFLQEASDYEKSLAPLTSNPSNAVKQAA